MKYDEGSWHSSGEFPADLSPEAGSTHIGIFVAWAVLNGLASDEQLEDGATLLEKLRGRKLTPAQWFMKACDDKFIDADLNAEGNAFATYYYGLPKDPARPPYLTDYAETFEGVDRIYYVTDSWENYDRLAPTISRRFAEWRKPQSPTPWWKRILK